MRDRGVQSFDRLRMKGKRLRMKGKRLRMKVLVDEDRLEDKMRNPLLTSPSSLLRLLPSTIVKQRCARERGANPGKPVCGATFSSWACRWYGPEIFVPYSFPRVNE